MTSIAAFSNFALQYVEWETGSGALTLPAASLAPLHIGPMDASVYLSPLVYTGFQTDATYGAGVASSNRMPASAYTYANPFSVQAGEVSPLSYYVDAAAI